jgi:hypothetical protein
MIVGGNCFYLRAVDEPWIMTSRRVGNGSCQGEEVVIVVIAIVRGGLKIIAQDGNGDGC